MSGADKLTLRGGKSRRTGYFMVELTGPAMALQRAGYELVFADPTGGEPTMDPASDGARWYPSAKDYAAAKRFIASSKGLRHPVKLRALDAAALKGFKAFFAPGGHAPMEDLYADPDMGRILRHFHEAGKPTALICHAPVALLAAVEDVKGAAGAGSKAWTYQGYAMTVFSTAEEQQEEAPSALDGQVLFYPADALRAAGAVVTSSAPWTSHAVVDRELITGQNPMSEAEFTKLFLRRLAQRP